MARTLRVERASLSDMEAMKLAPGQVRYATGVLFEDALEEYRYLAIGDYLLTNHSVLLLGNDFGRTLWGGEIKLVGNSAGRAEVVQVNPTSSYIHSQSTAAEPHIRMFFQNDPEELIETLREAAMRDPRNNIYPHSGIEHVRFNENSPHLMPAANIDDDNIRHNLGNILNGIKLNLHSMIGKPIPRDRQLHAAGDLEDIVAILARISHRIF